MSVAGWGVGDKGGLGGGRQGPGDGGWRYTRTMGRGRLVDKDRGTEGGGREKGWGDTGRREYREGDGRVKGGGGWQWCQSGSCDGNEGQAREVDESLTCSGERRE